MQECTIWRILCGTEDPNASDNAFPGVVRRVTDTERRNLAGLGDRELLEARGLMFGSDITLSAVLLLGNRPSLAGCAPKHELIFTRQRSPTGSPSPLHLPGLGGLVPGLEEELSVELPVVLHSGI